MRDPRARNGVLRAASAFDVRAVLPGRAGGACHLNDSWKTGSICAHVAESFRPVARFPSHPPRASSRIAFPVPHARLVRERRA
jgi:hypothetical protein